MGDAIAALDAAEVARADHRAGPAEMSCNGRARGGVHKVDVAAQLPCRHLLADDRRKLEQPGIGRQHEMIAVADLEEPHLLELARSSLLGNRSGVSEEPAQAALDKGNG